MKEFISAIYTYIKAGISGIALYNTQAPSTATYPYVVFNIFGSGSGTLDGDYDDSTIQFSIFDDDPESEDVLDLFASLDSIFDKDILVLSMDNYTLDSFTRYGTPFRLSIENEDGKNVWHLICQYDFILSEK